MSSDAANCFTKDNLDTYLRELAKEYRRHGGRAMPAEIVLIGGAAILANYGFRDMTTDVDAVIHAASTMRDAINHVGDRFGLPNGWLNADFMRTASYTPKLDQYSTYYRTFSNVLTVRTVTAEYLIAMKLRSGRKYKHDLSDIIGILAEHEKWGKPITAESIDIAVRNLYGGWDGISEDAKSYIQDVLRHGDYQGVYAEVAAAEQRTKDILIGFEQDYPGVANADNVEGIVKNLTAKQDTRTSILERLREREKQRTSAAETPPKKRDLDR